MVLDTFDIQRLEELMRLERTDCVCALEDYTRIFSK